MTRTRLVPLAALALAALTAGCTPKSPQPATTLTEAQRDSVLAREPIPGASAIGRAQAAAGTEAAHSAAMDTLAR